MCARALLYRKYKVHVLLVQFSPTMPHLDNALSVHKRSMPPTPFSSRPRFNTKYEYMALIKAFFLTLIFVFGYRIPWKVFLGQAYLLRGRRHVTAAQVRRPLLLKEHGPSSAFNWCPYKRSKIKIYCRAGTLEDYAVDLASGTA